METIWFWPLAVMAAMSVGMSKGGMPAMSSLPVPLLALVMSPVAAAGLLLPVYIVSDVFGLMAYRKKFNKRVMLIICAGATVGITLGGTTAHLVPEAAVTLAVGVIGAVFALKLILRAQIATEARHPRWLSGIFWGIVTGFVSFVSHSGAPPYQIWVLPLKLPKITFVGTTAVSFAYINIVKLVPYYLLGQLNADNLKIAVLLMFPAAVSVWVGVKVIQVVPQEKFFRVITWTLLFVSLRLIWQGADGLTHESFGRVGLFE